MNEQEIFENPTWVVVTFLWSGAFSSTTVNIVEKSFIPFADNVFIGPSKRNFWKD